MKPKMGGIRFTFLCAAVGLLLCLGCSSDTTVAGGSEVGNPNGTARVSGTVYAEDTRRAPGIAICLRPNKHNPVVDPAVCYADTTNRNGVFVIDGIPSRTYTLSGSADGSALRLFRPNIEVSTRDTVHLIDTVKESGYFLVGVPADLRTATGAVYVQGTQDVWPVDSTLIALDDALQSQLGYLYYLDENVNVSLPLNEEPFDVYYVRPDSVVFHPSYRPDPPTGPQSGRVAVEDTFQANTTPFPPWGDCAGGDDLIRLAWGDDDTTIWSAAKTRTHAWADTGAYRVRVQVRCEREYFARLTKLTSNWSEPLIVTITE